MKSMIKLTAYKSGAPILLDPDCIRATQEFPEDEADSIQAHTVIGYCLADTAHLMSVRETAEEIAEKADRLGKDWGVAMKVFTCTDFTGYWPVGIAAVIVAADIDAATMMLADRLESAGPPQMGSDPLTLIELDTDNIAVTILNDGNY